MNEQLPSNAKDLAERLRLRAASIPSANPLVDDLLAAYDLLMNLSPAPETNLGPREPNNDMVICPNCTSQFVAIPVNVQTRLAAAESALAEVLACLEPKEPGWHSVHVIEGKGERFWNALSDAFANRQNAQKASEQPKVAYNSNGDAYLVEPKAADDRIRRPTGQCSWGCYYSEDGKLVRDSACTVHGASSENG